MVHLNQKDPLNGPGKDGFSVRLRMVRAWIQERLAIIVQRSDPVAARGKTWLRAAMSSAAPKPGIGAGSAAARLEAAGRAIALRVTAAFRQVSVWLSVVRTKATKVPAGTLWRAFSPVLESVFRFPGRFILAAWRLAGSRWRATNKLAAFGQGLLTLLLIILAFTGLFVYAQFQPLSEMDIPDQQLLIPPGSSARSIGQILEERGIIRSGLAFLLVAKYQQAESRLVAGEYLLSPSQSPAEILSKMVKGDVIRRETQLTIPEGLTVKEIAGIVEEKLGVPQADFIRTASEGDFGYEYLRGISGGVHHLEGYLFPDTYKLKERSLAPEILGRMLARFDQVFDDRLRERARNMNFTIHQAVTLASIIEKESRFDDERPRVSAVFHNRLRIGMPLAADPTILFALGGHKEVVLYADLEVVSPYNTYKNAGLPPGPIAVPGKASLEAALYPAEDASLFFVAGPDGRHLFAKTFREHEENRRAVEKLKTKK